MPETLPELLLRTVATAESLAVGQFGLRVDLENVRFEEGEHDVIVRASGCPVLTGGCGCLLVAAAMLRNQSLYPREVTIYLPPGANLETLQGRGELEYLAAALEIPIGVAADIAVGWDDSSKRESWGEQCGALARDAYERRRAERS